MRSLLSFIAGAVALVALAAALPLGWVATHVASEDGYVAFSSGLIDDPDFRDDVVGVVTDDLIERSGVGEGGLVPGGASLVRTALSRAAAEVVEQPAFDEAFDDTQRQSHRAIFGDKRDLDPDLDASNRLAIDLAPMAQVIIDALTQNLPVDLDAPEQLLVTIGGNEQRQLIDAVNATPSQSAMAALVVAVAAGVCLLAARRRSTAVAWLGLGVAAVAGVVHLAADLGTSEVLSRNTTSTPLAARAQQLLADRAVDSLDGWLLAAAIAGAVAVVIGLIARSISGSRA